MQQGHFKPSTGASQKLILHFPQNAVFVYCLYNPVHRNFATDPELVVLEEVCAPFVRASSLIVARV